MIKKILILEANPINTERLALGEEVRQIKEKLERSKYRSQFKLEVMQAVRPKDLFQAMLDIKPQIVHFAGHGISSRGKKMENDSGDRKFNLVSEYDIESGGLIFEDDRGQLKLVNGNALANLFQEFNDTLECVLLNSCESGAEAQKIAQHISYAIGMNQAIGDRAAIEFAVGFYSAIVAGNSYKKSYELGRILLDLEGIPEKLTPVFFANPNPKISLILPEKKTNDEESQESNYVNDKEIAVWTEKLEFLREQENIMVDVAQKLLLKKLIEECQQKIEELERKGLLKNKRDRVFVSCAHEDRRWLEKLQTMLKPLIRKGEIIVWDDTKIKKGKWRKQIEQALASAKVAVLLVSPAFLASDFIVDRELPSLLKASENKELTILWIYLSRCLYQESEIEAYQAAHDISKPLDSLTRAKQDEVLLEICKQIKAAEI